MLWIYLLPALMFTIPVRGITGEAFHLVLLLATTNLSAYHALSLGVRNRVPTCASLLRLAEPVPALLLGAAFAHGYYQAILLLTLLLMVYYVGVGSLLQSWLGRWAPATALLLFAGCSFLPPVPALLSPVALVGPAVVQAASAWGGCYNCSHATLGLLTRLPVLLLPVVLILVGLTQSIDLWAAGRGRRPGAGVSPSGAGEFTTRQW